MWSAFVVACWHHCGAMYDDIIGLVNKLQYFCISYWVVMLSMEKKFMHYVIG